ncbi:uncharacterized protein LAJ45_05875 [Morchella importuna]|uniref:uncharacterized protein n=1 Tax=Morchella importuna TaxID=1174673 RepID=UPI001E8E42BE|nr:uncharacterized protein LAJ45_05875 [Morchella importuna]KAH8150189.1 hypothetical protein LAJ45_05875 [Morchella importuna]
MDNAGWLNTKVQEHFESDTILPPAPCSGSFTSVLRDDDEKKPSFRVAIKERKMGILDGHRSSASKPFMMFR